MFTKFGAATAVLAAMALGTLVPAERASAGCGAAGMTDDKTVGEDTVMYDSSAFGVRSFAAGLTRAGYIQTGGHDDGGSNAAIVGVWQFSFLSKGMAGLEDGTEIDAGYVTWHDDGTELMNSGRAPITGSFCMGAWKQIGASTFKLNHFALSWLGDGSTFLGPTNIREVITVNRRRDHYTGTFTIDQYDNTGVKVIGHAQGTVVAQRITAD